MTVRSIALGSALSMSMLGACTEPPTSPILPAPTPAAPTPAPEPLTPEVQAHRDAELRDWLAVDALIGRCYEARQVAEPMMAGAASVRFTVMPDGRAQNVAVVAADPHDVTAEACIVSAVEAMPFTPSASPVERTIERRFEAP